MKFISSEHTITVSNVNSKEKTYVIRNTIMIIQLTTTVLW